MDSNLREYISHVLSDGLQFIESIGKHLPTNVVKEKDSVTESFHKLIQKLNKCDTVQTPVNEKNQNKGKKREIPNDTEIKSEHEYISFQETIVLHEDLKNVTDNPNTQVEVTVDNEVKGMYYCLIDKGVLLLNKNLDREQAEYEIPLEKYAFRAEDKFKIKFVHNQLVIKLTFSCQTECENWLEYFFKAQQSIYSYASLPQEREPPREKLAVPGSPKLPPRPSHHKLQTQKSFPGVAPIFMRSKSAKTSHCTTDFVDLSTLNLDKVKQTYQQRLESNKPKPNIEDRKRQPIPLKQAKSLPHQSRIASPLHKNITEARLSPRGMFSGGAFRKH